MLVATLSTVLYVGLVAAQYMAASGLLNNPWPTRYALVLPSGGFDMEALGGQRIASPFDHVVFVDAVSGNYALLAG